MLTSIFATLSSVGTAITSVYNYLTGRSNLNNTPTIDANKQAQIDQANKEKFEQDLAQAQKSGNLTTIDKDVAQ